MDLSIIYKMKIFLSILLIITNATIGYSQAKSVALYVRDFEPHNTTVTRATAERAVRIANAVLNSQEFRDSIAKHSYPCKNYLSVCKKKCQSCSDIISTKTILDSLYRKTKWDLDLELNPCGGGVFGETSEDSHEINSCYLTIEQDDEVLPFEYKYAYHICHEYMHVVGFYHFQGVKQRVRYTDIAESTGWIAYYILDRWYKEGRVIP
jgi:hypothetical protein